MSINREKFSTQMDAVILADLRKIAKEEGRQLQAIFEEGMRAYLEQKQHGKVRPEVWRAYKESVRRFEPLYEKLAK